MARRIENGRATEYFAPQSRYIWSLAVAPGGVLFVGTGDQGKIFRIDTNGAGSLYYESGQQHITALAVDNEGRLLAGSEPNGPGGIQVRLEKASFDAMIGWLSRLSQQNGITVDGASIDSAGAPGLVNASIVLRQQ